MNRGNDLNRNNLIHVSAVSSDLSFQLVRVLMILRRQIRWNETCIFCKRQAHCIMYSLMEAFVISVWNWIVIDP